MANLTRTIKTQVVNFFGPNPATQWGTGAFFTMTWGSSQWGDSTIGVVTDLQRTLAAQAITPSDSFYKTKFKTLSFSLTFANAMTSGSMVDGGGYSYLFPLPTTDAINQSANTYTAGSSPSVSWTSAAAASGNWS